MSLYQKKTFVQGKIFWKKNYPRQVVLKNIPKIHAAQKLPSPPL